MGRLRPAIRYTLMILNLLLTLSLLLLNIFLTVSPLLLILHCLTLLPLLPYLPTALILSLLSSKRKFTRTLIETTYLTYQTFINLISSIATTLIVATTKCTSKSLTSTYNPSTGRYTYSQSIHFDNRLCQTRIVLTVLTWLAFFVTLFWMGWLINIARVTGGLGSGLTVYQAFRIPAGLLVSGDIDDYVAQYQSKPTPGEATTQVAIPNSQSQQPSSTSQTPHPVSTT